MKTRFRKLRLIYRIVSTTIAVLGIGYLILLAYPQALFANSVEHGAFKIYSREPIDPEIDRVLDVAEAKLKSSPIYDADLKRDVYLTNSHGLYAFFSPKAYNSFASSLPFVNHIIVNRTDVPADLVYIRREYSNSRSLSGVMAHETTHLLIRKRYGTLSATLMPTWKNEGYCEYVAGESTIPLGEGVRRWRENPQDDSNYRYTKYHLMVKHMLEDEKVSVEDLFTKSFDEKDVEARTFAALPQVN